MNKEALLKDTLYQYSHCKSFREVSRLPVARTSFNGVSMNMDMEVRTWFTRPDCYRSITSFMSNNSLPAKEPFQGSQTIFELISNKDGAVIITYMADAFHIDPRSGPQFRKEKTEKYKNIRTAVRNQFLNRTIHLLDDNCSHYLNKPRGIVQFPDKTINQRLCHHLVIYHGKFMQETHYWIDTKTKLVWKVENIESSLEQLPSRMYNSFTSCICSNLSFSDVQFDIGSPFREYLVQEVELDPEIDESMFALPC